ncbi:unnamed protein product [Cylindrotheca closterium]|uniref:Uncharacterized protein n=1 Tax=Cylindrotheca closterium TaxID=2856 RepID=A0AAD2CTB7_9STRA|nr:unnamed protein product [Cylindrotheca closterium]
MNRLTGKKKQRLSATSIFIWIAVGCGIAMLVVSSTTSGAYLRNTMNRKLSEIYEEAISNNSTRTNGLGSMLSLGPEEDRLLISELTQSPPPGSLECPEGFIAIYDRIIPETNSTTVKRKIPKILHISYKSRCLPAEVFGAGVQRWMDELPDYSVYFHDDDAVDRLMEAEWPEFPQLHRIMRCLQYKGAMKVDLWRMLVIYRFGGLYTDIDNVPAEEFKGGEVIDPEDTFFSTSDSWNRPNQNVFAMEPFHPIAIFTIQTIMKNLYEMTSLRKPQVVFVTGPMVFRDGYISYLELSYPYKTHEQILEAGLKKGKLGKQIHKEGQWNWGNIIGSEGVEYDGKNMSKKERDHLLAGTYHWSKVVYWNRNGLDLSCREYLYQLEHPSPENGIAANWTVLGR